ncbi:MAG: MCE family protein [Candidatus Omnitrophica bacterium]|nr:MCE family protein [Candidatus Omnitrophota bacterium]
MKTRLDSVRLKVGAFVLVGLILLFIFVFLVGDFSVFQPGNNIKVIFGFASGIKNASPVRLAGVDVGTVKDAKIFYDLNDKKTKVEVQLWIKNNINIPVDSKVWINTLGLLGEKYVEIIPGIDTVKFLANGDTIIGEDPVPVQEITRMAGEIASKLEESLGALKEIIRKINEGEGTIGKFVTDDEIYKDLELLVDDLKNNPWKLLHKPKGK